MDKGRKNIVQKFRQYGVLEFLIVLIFENLDDAFSGVVISLRTFVETKSQSAN